VDLDAAQALAGTLFKNPVTDFRRPSWTTAKSVPLIMSGSVSGPSVQEKRT
jgi:hypothetical protein